MKISVITLHDSQNYGSCLQAFATQEKLKQFAQDVEFINYRRGNSTIWGYFKDNLPLKSFILLPSLIRWRRVFGGFLKCCINLTTSCYASESDFEKFPLHDGYYCVGSDQIWNSKYNEGIIPPYYLSFVPDGKKTFTFSSSFGEEWLDDNEVALTKMYFERFDQISVREDGALRIVNEQYGCHNAVQLVDPTLAIPPDFWRRHAPKTKIKGDYILVYSLDYNGICEILNNDFDTYAKELSRRTGLPLVRLCKRYDQAVRCGKSVLIPDVLRFVTLIDNAKYVLTNSFHATAFSMNLNTEPIVLPPKKGFGRLTSFLRLVNEEYRFIADFDNYDIVSHRADFEHVNKVLDNERKRVDDFLYSVFRKETYAHDSDH